MNKLPIHAVLPKVFDSLESHHNLVLQAEPGAGKSTVLPLSLLTSSWLGDRKILMLEPRRVAAKSIAHYLARQLNETVGQRVGYHIKNDRKASSDTILEVVTEGILTRRLQNNPELPDVSLIIFDEFHERSLHADIALMLSLDIQQTLREDLKLLVMSATIDTHKIARYMGGAEIIECEGKHYPVGIHYRSPPQNTPLINHVIATLSVVLKDNPGDILVFLPGQADIRRGMTAAQSRWGHDESLAILPLYGSLSLTQQEQAITPDPSEKRRLIFATNIAETSLTIDGITVVIDSGLEKTLIFDPSSGMTRLETIQISKASAEQRKGRAGRTQAGTCIRLWSEQKNTSLDDFQKEEILNADLTATVLELLCWGETQYDKVHWLTPPPKAHFSAALATLKSLDLVLEDATVTSLGKRAVALGLPPRLATMILKTEAGKDDKKHLACELAALINERDILTIQNADQTSKGNHHIANSSDICLRLIALQDYKHQRHDALKNYPINKNRIETVLLNARGLKQLNKASPKQNRLPVPFIQDTASRLLLHAYPDRLARQRAPNSHQYLLANGRGVYLQEADALFGNEFLIVVDCDAKKKEGRILQAVAIDQATVMEQLQPHITTDDVFYYDEKKCKFIGRRELKYHAIIFQSKPISDIPPEEFQRCLSSILQTQGFILFNWTAQCDDWLNRAEWLGHQLPDFPKLSKESLLNSCNEWLLPYISHAQSIADLKKVDMLALLSGHLSWDDQQRLDKEAPRHYVTPSQKSTPIRYDAQQGPVVSVQLQEMFGEINSPSLAEGRVPIRFELLSPARRPIQTTSDLKHFWQSSYFDVAKEMRGRYPKHRWPDNPLEEKAGRSIKRR